MLITDIKNINQSTVKILKKLNIVTVGDLLLHLPFRYEDHSQIVNISNLAAGMRTTTQGIIIATQVIYIPRRQFIIKIQDGLGVLIIRMFNFNKWQEQYLKNGNCIRCFGEVYQGKHFKEMIHPEYQIISNLINLPYTKTLTPIYSKTEGITQQRLRSLINEFLFDNEITINQDFSLNKFISKYLNIDLKIQDELEIFKFLHSPPHNTNINQLNNFKHSYQKKIIFEELLAHHLGLINLRDTIKNSKAKKMENLKTITSIFLQELPFELTYAQKKVIQEIENDLAKSQPMLRLLQGDVGSGKTVVAAYCALIAISNNMQVAIMAPTEILANQHLQSFTSWFKKLNIDIAFLTKEIKKDARAKTLNAILNGEVKLIIGTHALIEDNVKFKNLNLIIIDEQHRFGVSQRLLLNKKGKTEKLYPHQLIMSATPIPRSLAMSYYLDLDHSIIDELPKDRKPIDTVLMQTAKKNELIARLKILLQKKTQVYWVCTLITESEILQTNAAEKTFLELKNLLSEFNIALIHSRISTDEKNLIMSAFKNGNIDILVATTVVEVGVDVPNATVMIIENPERLGLSQLHQLRGRVGRGSKKSFCVLLYQEPLSVNAKKRLAIMREYTDGFTIAEKDLQMRGCGEIIGKKQSGAVNMKIANLMRDAYLLPHIKKCAEEILQVDNAMVQLIIKKWIKNITAR